MDKVKVPTDWDVEGINDREPTSKLYRYLVGKEEDSQVVSKENVVERRRGQRRFVGDLRESG